MTRAQSWLIVAAAGKLASNDAWYDLIRRGLEAAGAEARPGGGLIYRIGDWPDPQPGACAKPPEAEPLPDWAQRPAPAAPHPPIALSPSNLPGAKVVPGDPGDGDPDALWRGTALHLLLEHLPGQGAALWPALADALLGESSDKPALLAEAAAVLTAPDLAWLFAADALTEVSITAEMDGLRLMGAIDRLIIEPERVLAIDYKSNALVPTTAAELPEGLRRQMQAYGVALAQIYPDRRIDCAILWTKPARLMPLDFG